VSREICKKMLLELMHKNKTAKVLTIEGCNHDPPLFPECEKVVEISLVENSALKKNLTCMVPNEIATSF